MLREKKVEENSSLFSERSNEIHLSDPENCNDYRHAQLHRVANPFNRKIFHLSFGLAISAFLMSGRCTKSFLYHCTPIIFFSLI